MRDKIEKVMYSDKTGDDSKLASGLRLLSRFYGAAIRLRAFGYQSGYPKTNKLPCKVISIGNIAVGGTGKTPMTIYLAEMLNRLGFKPVVISRGYKGRAEKRGGIVSDGRTFFMTAEKTGDEPLMMARRLQTIGVPVVVGRNRFRSGTLAVRVFRPDVILLDDAYQHLKLWRDLNLVLLDGTHPFGNTHLLPRGTLREPVSALDRGDIFVLTRTEEDDTAAVGRLRGIVGNRPVFTAFHKPFISRWVAAGSRHWQTPADVRAAATFGLLSLRDRRVFGFSGIAGNDGFRETLELLGCDLTGFTGFADHHPYSSDDVAALLHAAGQSGAEILCTTEKDFIRLAHKRPWPIDLVVIGIDMSLGSRQAAFEEAVVSRLGSGAGA
ncbi:MAG: tetraacyldisaccharide 4'-kinase [Desulfobacterales bacterium]